MIARRRRGIAWMVGAGLCWSLGGVLVRGVDQAGALEIVFWRSLFMVAFVALVVLAVHGRDAPAAVRDLGGPGLAASLCLQGAFFAFIGALALTTVANTLVIMSTTPMVTAMAARLILGERIGRPMLVAMPVVSAGMALMVADGMSRGGLAGDLVAALIPLCMAGHIIFVRHRAAKVDMLPCVLVAGLISLGIALPLAWPLRATMPDLGLLAIMGTVQLGLGCLCLIRAARHLGAAEIGLLSLIEPIVGPLWVWLVMSERPSGLALAGGVVVIGAMVFSEAQSARQRTKDALASRNKPVHASGMDANRS